MLDTSRGVGWRALLAEVHEGPAKSSFCKESQLWGRPSATLQKHRLIHFPRNTFFFFLGGVGHKPKLCTVNSLPENSKLTIDKHIQRRKSIVNHESFHQPNCSQCSSTAGPFGRIHDAVALRTCAIIASGPHPRTRTF